MAGSTLNAVARWGSRLREADTNRLNKVIRKASDVIKLDSVQMVSERRNQFRLRSILSNDPQPLLHPHDVLVNSRSTFSNRLIPAKRSTESREILLSCSYQTL